MRMEFEDLSIASSGGDNVAQTIIDPALTNLQLIGGGGLEIDAILGVKPTDGQSVDIDASGLSGFLTLNAGGISDLAAGGRPVSIALGAGGGAVTDMNASEAVTVTLGAGQGRLYFADGATHVAIAGLRSADQVSVGDATVADTFINGLSPGSSQQTSIDASANLLAAATTAATAAGASLAHQAVLFSYKGDSVRLRRRGGQPRLRSRPRCNHQAGRRASDGRFRGRVSLGLARLRFGSIDHACVPVHPVASRPRSVSLVDG